MASRARFALVWLCAGALLLGALAAASALLWADLDAAERAALAALLAPRAPLLALLAVVLLGLLGALLHWAWRAYPRSAHKLAERVRLTRTVHPGHRLPEAGAPELRALAREVNALAAAHEQAQQAVQARVDATGARLAQESARLAALMAELAQAVLVCNREGRVLLYNAQAARLFGAAAAGEQPPHDAPPLGLGRSVYGLIDRALIEHALQRVASSRGDTGAAHFVALRGARWLRVRLAPVRDAQGASDGYVLVVDDVTRSVEADSRRDELLRRLTEGSRAALGVIRAAADALDRHADIDSDRRARFTRVIADEAARLTQVIDAAQADTPHTPPAPLEDMHAADFVLALQRALAGDARLPTQADEIDDALWLSVDCYPLTQVLVQLMRCIADGRPLDGLALSITPAAPRHALLVLRWQGAPPDSLRLRGCAEAPCRIQQQLLTLPQVLARHAGEWWLRSSDGACSLCLQLPALAAPAQVQVARGQRPVYYDFDLFHQPGQTPELDERALSELDYTVFDTETTGLAPADGDEIIAIGAVRIVAGKMLEQEVFDHLIDPRRAVSKASQQVHGITPEMLAGQPIIEQVLPAFHRYAEGTVLVAHNAAFDMRFLQLKEAATGVRFEQPVLDTLLLSALVHPGHRDAEHRLEAIAERLGVAVVARHSALGDARVTAQVFLKLIPLLAERGIRTLGQAREAARKTVYAKLDY
jgi:DNA polymerase-3 subunit epsilon